MSDVLVANVIFPRVFLVIFFVLACFGCLVTILIGVFIFVFPNDYVILVFILKGPLIGFFLVILAERSASSP